MVGSPGFTPREGAHPETTALRNVLAHAVASQEGSWSVVTEPMLLGIGGGLGGAYALLEVGRARSVLIGGRLEQLDVRGGFAERACDRLGVGVTRRETSSSTAAESALRETLADGRSALAWVGLAALSYSGLPREWSKAFVHVIAVHAIDDDAGEAVISDRTDKPFRIPLENLRAARSAIPAVKNRLLALHPSSRPPDLRRAIQAGIRDCWSGLLFPASKGSGLAAFRRWAGLVTHPREKKGWPALLRDGATLISVLSSAYESIAFGGGGGLFRFLYADFLDEAADFLGRRDLSDAAEPYRAAAKLWEGVAEALLPDRVPELAKARKLLQQREHLFRSRGPAARADLQRIQRELEIAKTTASRKHPLPGGHLEAFLREIESRILAAADVEDAAARQLQATTP